MRVALVVLAVSGCGGATTTSEPVGNRAAPPPKPTCSEALVADLARRLEARWNTSTTPLVRCTPGRFPTPGFYIEVDDGETHRAGVLADDGETELVPFADRGARMFATSIAECATVDLDGDGVDEIVETWRRRAHGPMGATSWLEIRQLADRGFHDVRGPFTSVYHPDLGGCSAEVRLAGRTIVVTIENLPGIPPSDCLAPGPHAFALDQGELVEVDVQRVSRR